MSLKKEVVIDKVEVLESGVIQVRQATRVLEDGVVLSTSYHRHCVSPGDDTSGQDARVKSIAAAMWTPEVIKAYKASLPAEPADAPNMPLKKEVVINPKHGT